MTELPLHLKFSDTRLSDLKFSDTKLSDTKFSDTKFSDTRRGERRRKSGKGGNTTENKECFTRAEWAGEIS